MVTGGTLHETLNNLFLSLPVGCTTVRSFGNGLQNDVALLLYFGVISVYAIRVLNNKR